MHQLPIEQQALLLLQIGAMLLLCLRLWNEGLNRVYPYFYTYLALELGQTLIPIVVPIRSLLYRDLFVISQALISVFSVLVVLELYSRVLNDLPGISSVARRYIRIVLALALVVAVLPFGVEKHTATWTGYLFLFERVIMSSQVVFLLLITVFLLYYPVPLGRNVIVYLAGYALYFVVITTVSFVQNMGFFWIRLLGSVEMAVFLACLTLWLLMLSRKGELKQVVVGHQWNPGDDQRLLSQLEAINASLLRSARK